MLIVFDYETETVVQLSHEGERLGTVNADFSGGVTSISYAPRLERMAARSTIGAVNADVTVANEATIPQRGCRR